MATIKENLIAARSLIDTPEKWGKGSDSFTSYGKPQSCTACAHEALKRTLGDRQWDASEGDALVEALRMALPKKFDLTPDYNDHPKTTHADIMDLFDRAIAMQASF